MEKTLLKNLSAILWQYRRRFIKAVTFVIIANALFILTPLVFKQAVMAFDQQASIQPGLLNTILSDLFGTHLTTIWFWTILLLALSLAAVYFKYQMRLEFISISREAEFQMRSRLFSRMQEQSMAFYDRHGVGELLSRLTNDIGAYRDMLGPGFMYPSFFITLLIPGLWALFMISPTLTTISLVPLVLIPLLNLSTRNWVFILARQAQKGLADLSNLCQEHYSGIRIVKGYVAEKHLSERFSNLCKRLIGINIKLNCLQGALTPFFNLLTKLSTVLLVVFTGLITLKGWGELSTADFLAFMWIQGIVFFPILMLAWILPIYQRGNAAYTRLAEVYHEPIEVQDNCQSKAVIPVGADIEFKNLTFYYPNSQKKILDDLSLKIPGGTFVGITGPIGAGKSTLFRLLNREYEIPANTLFVGGRDVHDYPLEAFWQEIVTVEQAPFLFSRTIKENLTVGNPEAIETEMEAAASYADLHETVLGFPEQYNTIVGERGVTLSGGQKQRMAMARAFLVDRSIILLDDIFSAIDAETEMRIFMGLREKLQGKTIVFITHRISVLNALDRVIYMQEGKIIEDGPPDLLKAQKGYYAALDALHRFKES